MQCVRLLCLDVNIPFPSVSLSCDIIPPPNPAWTLGSRSRSGATELAAMVLPYVILWNPIDQFQCYFEGGIYCPKRNCRKPLHISQWNIGNSISHSPRLLHGVDHTILLVAVVYSCAEGHEIYSTDPHILELFPEEEQIPFILLCRTGFTRDFARTVIHMTLEGMSLSSTERLIRTRRLDLVGSLQLKLNSIKHYTSIPIPANVHDVQCVKLLYQPFPSNDLLYRCFTSDFSENKEYYFAEMASLSIDDYISLDHTFKVASNLGYLRPDGNWVSQYGSAFFVLNSIGQVIAWQFTKSTSTEEVKNLLDFLNQRISDSQNPRHINMIMVDNCCTLRNKLTAIFGPGVKVRLDLFHAVQRIVKCMSKKHPMYMQCLQDVKQLFRDPADKGKDRTLPTPAPDTLITNLDMFVQKWKCAQVDGSRILNENTLHEIEAIRVHILRGCLSQIPPKCGTNKNEALHRAIRPFFNRCRMGIPLALALMTASLHFYNKKQACKHNKRPLDFEQSVLLGRASHKARSVPQQDSGNQFGIVSKTGNAHVDSWIFHM